MHKTSNIEVARPPCASDFSGSLILQAPIAASDYESVIKVIGTWVQHKSRRMVSVCTVHSVVTARWNPQHRLALETSDLCTADGVPLVWVLKQRGFTNASRVYGPTLMLKLLETASAAGWRVALYGGHPDRLPKLIHNLEKQFPKLKLVCAICPPFRPPTQEEADQYNQQLNQADPDLVFVGIGCPKQELWMQAHRLAVPGVKLGVGAAFDFHAGAVPQAPPRLQSMGLEWAYRLWQEPRRLFRRYLVTNSVFIGRLLLEQTRLLGEPKRLNFTRHP
jgi:N-acetylglucosaminyldiphosphoundecaprenol N-acetyl-beta-D-mannosaminyltransferase